MKIVNIILSILVLLLAAVSAVSSYMLYQKRGLLLGGWNEMAKTIHQTATILDNGSGTDEAQKLTEEALSHENYASLPENLQSFTSQAQKIQQQRNELGSTVAKVADILAISDAPSADDLTNLNNYQTSSKTVISGVRQVKDREDTTASAISEIASKLGTSVSSDELLGEGYKGELSKLSARADDINRRIERFNNSIKKIASSVGAGDIALDDESYITGLTRTVASVTKLRLDYESTLRELRQKTGELNALAKSSKEKDRSLAEYDKKISELKKTIAILQGSGAGGKMKNLVQPWKDGSKEALSAVKGQVIDVNNKYGFVVINLGKNTLVEQKIGNSLNRVNPEIRKDCDMIVARGLDSNHGQFIGRIKLVKVNENCTIANVVPGSLDGRRIKVGDSVYFSNETIAKIGK